MVGAGLVASAAHVTACSGATRSAMKAEWLTGYSYLVAGEEPPSGLGLYSYLLMRSATGAGGNSRAVAAIRVVRASASPNEAVFVWTQRRRALSLIFLPVTKVPVSSAPEGETPEDVLQQYDFGRSDRLLHHLQLRAAASHGIFIVSSMSPLTSDGAVRSHILTDLTDVWTADLESLVAGIKRETYKVTDRWDADQMEGWVGRLVMNLHAQASDDESLRRALAASRIEWRRGTS